MTCEQGTITLIGCCFTLTAARVPSLKSATQSWETRNFWQNKLAWTQAWPAERPKKKKRRNGDSTWHNVLLVIIRVGNCTDWKRGFGVPRLRFFIILTEVVDFLILLQVSAERRNSNQATEKHSRLQHLIAINRTVEVKGTFVGQSEYDTHTKKGWYVSGTIQGIRSGVSWPHLKVQSGWMEWGHEEFYQPRRSKRFTCFLLIYLDGNAGVYSNMPYWLRIYIQQQQLPAHVELLRLFCNHSDAHSTVEFLRSRKKNNILQRQSKQKHTDACRKIPWPVPWWTLAYVPSESPVARAPVSLLVHQGQSPPPRPIRWLPGDTL